MRIAWSTTSLPRRFRAETPTAGVRATGDRPDETAVAENPYETIPVFHFRSNRRRVKSQLAIVVEVQDAVNKLLADMMVAAEFGAFPQRYVISAAGIANLKNNQMRSGTWWRPSRGCRRRRRPVLATDLQNYLSAINKLSADIGIITHARHYFISRAAILRRGADCDGGRR